MLAMSTGIIPSCSRDVAKEGYGVMGCNASASTLTVQAQNSGVAVHAQTEQSMEA